MVGRAGDTEGSTQRLALGQLLQIYLPALRDYLVRVRHVQLAEAEDLVQAFISAKFLEKNLATGADPARGRFRTLLLKSLDRFVISERRKASALKRGGRQPSALDAAEIDPPDPGEEPSSGFDVAWAQALLAEVIRRMQAECEESGRPELWGVFECRVLQPILQESEPTPYDELVRRFGFQSPVQASNVLVTAKRTFDRLLRTAVSEYATSAAEVDEEIRDLRVILERGSNQS